MAIGTLLLVFIVLMVVFRRRAIENADIVGRRAGQASKVATKRLKKARRLKDTGNTAEFFDEVLRALWGYVGDKLNIPVEQLSQENISDRLRQRNVDQQAISQFIDALEECEFERYAPGDSQGNMNKVYQKAVSAIEQIEQNMKRRLHRPSTQGTALAIAALLSVMPVLGLAQPADSLPTRHAADSLPTKAEAANRLPTKAQADSAYMQGHYQQAIELYEQLLGQGKSAAIYYNLGNAYYRTDDITRAVLAYERAQKMAPGDDDIRFNLQMAREKTIDKIVPRSEMFFVTWWHALVNMQSADGWAMMAIAALALAVVLLLIYLFVQQIWLRKVGFFGGAMAVLTFLMANLLAWQQQALATASPGAVVTAPATSVKSTPAKGGTDLFILHEGSRVDIIDDTMREWKEIEVADGKRGWIEKKHIERI
jgi:tetratricopeptide (TPR) repeat protein